MAPLPVVLHGPIRVVLTILLALSVASFVTIVLSKEKGSPTERQSQRISWHGLIVLLLPFTVAYFGLLVPRAIANFFYDRYVLVLLSWRRFPLCGYTRSVCSRGCRLRR
jgi:heme A synthase